MDRTFLADASRQDREGLRAPAPCAAPTLGLLIALAAGSLPGCAGDRPTSEATEGGVHSLRDSAGVMIAESTGPAWPAGAEWSLSEQPSVQIGVIDGAPEFQFSGIVGAWRFADGGIAVGDRVSREIRYFDADGGFRIASGGEGDGPGEFRTLLHLTVHPGDSLLVYDSGARRLSIFDREGRLGRTATIPFPDPGPPAGTGGRLMMSGIPQFLGILPDGRYLLQPGVTLGLEPGEKFRVDRTLLGYEPADGRLDTLGIFPGPEDLAPPLPGGGPFVRLPYPERLPLAVGGEGFLFGAGGAYEIQLFGSHGDLERVIRASHLDLTVDQAARGAYLEAQRAQLMDGFPSDVIERALREVEFPAALPGYSELLVDSEAHIWARDFRLPGEEGPEGWSVFDPEGRLLGTVQTPEGFTVYQIGLDFVLGSWADELGVPYVRMYRLNRS